MSANPERPIRVLIVDDEYPARAEMRYHCGRFPDVEIIGEAATAREALHLIENLEYDVVFLDIAMPGVSGIELAQQLRDRPGAPAVVFVSAYDEYALKAFETRALDYLLKPLDPARLSEALQRVRERTRLGRSRAAAGHGAGAGARTDPGDEEVPGSGTPGRRDGSVVDASGGTRSEGGGSAGGGGAGSGAGDGAGRGGRVPEARWVLGVLEDATIPIPVDEVVYITAEQDQVMVYTRQSQYLTRQALRELEQALPADRFFRCHRGYIVNLSHVRAISPFANGTYLLTVRQGGKTTTIPVARSRAAELKRRFWPGA
ncbi:MAG: LytTR family transcriptional regulator DNA-binding domain-containing protein [Thermaerobacter sp.]